MRKLKLFSKTYIFTMALMSMIILISHSLIYIALPKVYISNKQKEGNKIIEELIGKLEVSDEETAMNLAKKFAKKYNTQIFLTLDGKTKVFQDIDSMDIYVNPNEIKDDSIVLPDINNNYILDEDSNYFLDSNENISAIDIDNFNQYINIKNSSVIKSQGFKTSSGTDGKLQIVMKLESFQETRDVIFNILPYSMVLSLIISLIASYLYARKVTTPIKEISDVTREMELLNKAALCKANTEDEIGVLARNINSLYGNLLNTIASLEGEIENVSKSEKMKVDFLRSASHELKTPLMSIHIMLENMILDIGKYKNHYVYLEKCKEIVNKLSHMIQEILDTSKLNNINEKNENIVDLADLIQKTIESYKLIAKAKNINMIINIENSFNIKVDEKLFSKALSNIISNTVNYTDEGKEIRIYIEDKKLIVENECTPIPKDHLKHIFEAFYRADFDRNKSNGGNGLGLYIVKEILKNYNLSYSFKDMPGGMKFTISFENQKNYK